MKQYSKTYMISKEDAKERTLYYDNLRTIVRSATTFTQVKYVANDLGTEVFGDNLVEAKEDLDNYLEQCMIDLEEEFDCNLI